MAGAQRRSGFAALIGRPNVGKSTLLNRLTGEKLAIVSPKPQTTRNRILGVVTRQQGQVAFLDTPGIHRARGQLNRYMLEVALQAAAEVDLLVFMIEAADALGTSERKAPRGRPPGRPAVTLGNRFILERLHQLGKPTFLVINKIDQIERRLLLPLIELYRSEFPFAEVVPISARSGEGVEELLGSVLQHLPEAEPMFAEDMLTDQAERQLVAEYVREQVLAHCREEIPYSAAVVVDVFDESERARPPDTPPDRLSGLVRIEASIFVERESQKAIVIGKKGQMLKRIGTDARKSIERLLGAHVYLSLRVRVEPGWSERPEALRKLGYR
ncbi:MAG: GTPase Era [Myxococcales bacterium]|nr:GTPase Era [Myxococcales bacterium]